MICIVLESVASDSTICTISERRCLCDSLGNYFSLCYYRSFEVSFWLSPFFLITVLIFLNIYMHIYIEGCIKFRRVERVEHSERDRYIFSVISGDSESLSQSHFESIQVYLSVWPFWTLVFILQAYNFLDMLMKFDTTTCFGARSLVKMVRLEPRLRPFTIWRYVNTCAKRSGIRYLMVTRDSLKYFHLFSLILVYVSFVNNSKLVFSIVKNSTRG